MKQAINTLFFSSSTVHLLTNLFEFMISPFLCLLPTPVSLFSRINTHLFVCSERVWRHGI